jgi:hypothetical protein
VGGGAKISRSATDAIPLRKLRGDRSTHTDAKARRQANCGVAAEGLKKYFCEKFWRASDFWTSSRVDAALRGPAIVVIFRHGVQEHTIHHPHWD